AGSQTGSSSCRTAATKKYPVYSSRSFRFQDYSRPVRIWMKKIKCCNQHSSYYGRWLPVRNLNERAYREFYCCTAGWPDRFCPKPADRYRQVALTSGSVGRLCPLLPRLNRLLGFEPSQYSSWSR